MGVSVVMPSYKRSRINAQLGAWKMPREMVSREEAIVRECKGKSVLHIGCADYPYVIERLKSGTWLHGSIQSVAKECRGVDNNPEAIAYLSNVAGISGMGLGDAERLGELGDRKYEVIVAGEIIEHLNNVGVFLMGAREMLTPEGRLVISTVNAFCLRRMIRVGLGKESVHPDHVCYYSHRTLTAIAQRYGFRPELKVNYRLPNRRPIVPFLVERAASIICPSWCEGILHVYSWSSDSE